MRHKSTLMLIGFGCLSLLLLAFAFTRIRVRVTSAPATWLPYSVLQDALSKDLPDDAFERLLRENPALVKQQKEYDRERPLLAQCAMLQKTNLIRVLLRHGIDHRYSVEFLIKANAEESAALLRALAAEHYK
jgi:hypothetical protein